MNKIKKGKEIVVGIYYIKNPIGQYYIGSSKNIYKRWTQHGEKCKSTPKLQKSMIKYGKDKHEFKIVCICSEKELIEKEAVFQLIYKSVDEGLNVAYSDRRGWKQKPESIEKMRQTKTGTTLTTEHKIKIGLALKGVKRNPLTEEHKLKISKCKKGYKLNLTDEERESRRLKIIEIAKRNGKKVICNQTNVIYNSIADACKAKNINEGTLRWWFKHPRLNKSTLSLVINI